MAKIAAKACARVPVEQRQACFTRATRPDVAGID